MTVVIEMVVAMVVAMLTEMAAAVAITTVELALVAAEMMGLARLWRSQEIG